MAHINPFRALRPDRRYAEKVAAPPYDVINVEEAREMARGNPWCFLHVEKSEIDLPGYPEVEERRCSGGGTQSGKVREERILLQDQALPLCLCPGNGRAVPVRHCRRGER